MRHLGEEKAALLLPAADDDDDEDDDNHEMMNSPSNGSSDQFPVIAKRPRTYQRRSNSSTHPILCFTLILGAFILGCLSGVFILLYRMSQDAEHGPSTLSPNQITTNVDLSIQTKLFESITKTNFLNLNHSIESENDAADKLYKQWQSLSSSLSRVNKFSYDINLAKYAPMTQWTGLQLLDGKNGNELLKVDRLLTEDFISFSSLIKSDTTVDGTSMYYVNYGRKEDFAYLFINKIRFVRSDKSIVFMRRKSTIISQTEQIHQANYYGFGAVVFFDDNENQQITTTNDRHPYFLEWARKLQVPGSENYVESVPITDKQSIAVLILSYDDVLRIFGSLQPDSNQWLPCPTQWHEKTTQLKIGGTLSSVKLRLVVHMEEVKAQLPVVMSSIRSTNNAEHFVMIGYQIGSTQQNKIVNEIIQAYTNQIKNGWKPRRSILFCAWSGLHYDHYTIHRWISDNYRFINTNLIAYIDLGYDIIGNSTLNLHGSPLLEQVAYRAANFVPSPLEHNHTCHHRQMTTTTTTVANEENPHHDHGRKRRDSDHEHRMETSQPIENECKQHKLLDEWLRASHNQIGLNKSLGIVQSIDADSAAALFQLRYGIPSIVIEMTDEQALSNDTFFVPRSPAVFNGEIQPEIFVAYTQFICEIIRQLIDEPLISFNLTNYADQIDRQVTEYLEHFDKAYESLSYHIGESSAFKKTLDDLTKSFRQSQLRIDQTPKTDYIRLQALNKQLIEFERLLISNNQLDEMNSVDKIYKHILTGPAFGLTNAVVSFPSLSNILYRIPPDPPGELCDASKLYWLKLKEDISNVKRTLNGFDGLLTKDK